MLSKNRNILIVSASIGAGHNQAAKAVRDEILRQDPQAIVNIIDYMDGENSYLNALIKETYLKMIDMFPDMYDFLYRWSQAPQRGSKVQNLMARTMKRSMMSLLNRYHPDIAIFTHPFPCGAAAYLRRTGQIHIPIAAVITDFAVHRMWVYNEVDLYFVAGLELKEALVQEGIYPERVMVSGIPIHYSFSQTMKRKHARQQLGISDQKPTILLMGGGLGLGPVKEALRTLNHIKIPLELIVVAGSNPDLRRSLSIIARNSPHKMHVLGFTDKIPLLMAASDFLITKPGALTSSEALAMELPMIFYKPLPGQEQENASYLTARGAALWAKNRSELDKILMGLLGHPYKLKYLKERARIFKCPEAASRVYRAVKYFISSIEQDSVRNQKIGGK